MAFDLTTALTTFAPTLATMLGGPLAGVAVTSLEGALGLAPGAGSTGIATVLQTGSMTSETLAAVHAADLRHSELLGQQGIDLARINTDHEAAMAIVDATDVKSAREINSGHDATWWIAIVILITFAFIMTAVIAGYVLQRLIEGMFLKDFKMNIHVWRPFDSQFRLITARRNPNMVILFAGLLVTRPDWGIIGVAAWTAISLVVHLVRLVQAMLRKARGETLVSWLA